MSIYPAIETVVVAAIALVSVFYVLKLVVPGSMHNVCVRIAGRLTQKANVGLLNRFAATLRVDSPSGGGCATGCQSGCRGCSIAAGAATQPARDDVLPR